MLELADKYFKAAIIKMFKTNEKVEDSAFCPHKNIEDIKKSQKEHSELKYT